jgi:pyruvate,orthophosphate dikinase
MAVATKYVYYFGPSGTDGSAGMKALLGGKGANLAEMTRIGLPVPAGFTITTEVCTYFYDHDHQYPPELRDEVTDAMRQMEQDMGAKFGDAENPLLVSCRSGARDSMPGMMDTVLNIGLNDTTVEALAKKSNNPRFAYDCYRRFIQMYGDVVMGVEAKGSHEDPFEHAIEAKRAKLGVKHDHELTADALKELVTEFKKIVKDHSGKSFPEDPMDQVWGAVGAVFGSWMNDRAIVYRRTYGIPHEWGTAVNVQSMVFGNLGDDCATGVGLTRDVALGNPGFNGDYLINAQGEDVVAGIRTPKVIEDTLSEDMPVAFKELVGLAQKLEAHYKDVQDIEFTIQQGKVWILQTRNAKRTGFAAVRIAADMVNEGLIDEKEALLERRCPADGLNQLLQPLFDQDAKAAAKKSGKHLATGIAAGPGAATGIICLHAHEAEAMYQKDNSLDIILVRRETSPEDLRGMKVAKGILTAFGGASSHAALVSRQMGKPCVVGCGALNVDYKNNTVSVGDTTLKVGDNISIDGFTGEVFAGKLTPKPSEVQQVLIDKTMKPEDSTVYAQFDQLMKLADKYRKLGVRTNADSPKDAAVAIAFGAEGIGLCRTEHMFFDHIDEFRRMILSEAPGKDLLKARKEAGISNVFAMGKVDEKLLTEREKALQPLLGFQREDFEGLFKAMAGKPVTIRLLDPPLHEFLPHEESAQVDLAKKLGLDAKAIQRRVAELHESNPMLGHRGCRLGIVYPEITAMQARAIFEAAVACKKAGVIVLPEVMIPLAGYLAEFKNQEKVVREVASAVFAEQHETVEYLVGTMIEIPRAALRADQIAEAAQFFSFGTNDLTQTTLGISRDDYKGFINHYLEADIMPADPFQSIDQEGVGYLMRHAVVEGRKTRPDLKMGICGEHGGDPRSVMFCHTIGLSYVSCSPLRVPIARLSAAQIAVSEM